MYRIQTVVSRTVKRIVSLMVSSVVLYWLHLRWLKLSHDAGHSKPTRCWADTPCIELLIPIFAALSCAVVAKVALWVVSASSSRLQLLSDTHTCRQSAKGRRTRSPGVATVTGGHSTRGPAGDGHPKVSLEAHGPRSS